MTKNGYQNLIIIVLALAFGITACASGTGEPRGSGTRGNLNRLKINKEGELRQNRNHHGESSRAFDKDYTEKTRNII